MEPGSLEFRIFAERAKFKRVAAKFKRILVRDSNCAANFVASTAMIGSIPLSNNDSRDKPRIPRGFIRNLFFSPFQIMTNSNETKRPETILVYGAATPSPASDRVQTNRGHFFIGREIYNGRDLLSVEIRRDGSAPQ